MVYRIIALLIGYCCGLFQTGFIYGRLHDFDLREHGSGNSGMTNAMRTLGMKAGVTVLLGDLLKAVAAVLVVRFGLGGAMANAGGVQVDIKLLELYACLGVILGHDFPFYLRFKGGKGMAASAGYLISSVFCVLVPELILFLVIVIATKYISLGSIITSAVFPLLCFAQWRMGFLRVSDGAIVEFVIVAIVVAAINVFQHRANISRLLAGQENRFSVGKKDKV